MGLSNWAAAMLLLAGVVIVTVAGVAALDASHQQTDSTLEDAGESSPEVLETGESAQSAILTALPWIGLIVVPLGIAGILAAVAYSFPTNSNGRMTR